MDRQALEDAVGAGLSQRKIAAQFNCGHATVRWWLARYGLHTTAARVHHENCVLCGKPSHGRRVCPPCWTRVRRCRAKLIAIALLGGKCNKCGWSGHPAGFDFHHRFDKEFGIGSAANKSWAVLKKELEKCELLCANCHRMHTSKMDDPKLLKEAGRFLKNGFILAEVAQFSRAFD